MITEAKRRGGQAKPGRPCTARRVGLALVAGSLAPLWSLAAVVWWWQLCPSQTCIGGCRRGSPTSDFAFPRSFRGQGSGSRGSSGVPPPQPRWGRPWTLGFFSLRWRQFHFRKVHPESRKWPVRSGARHPTSDDNETRPPPLHLPTVSDVTASPTLVRWLSDAGLIIEPQRSDSMSLDFLCVKMQRSSCACRPAARCSRPLPAACALPHAQPSTAAVNDRLSTAEVGYACRCTMPSCLVWAGEGRGGEVFAGLGEGLCSCMG